MCSYNARPLHPFTHSLLATSEKRLEAGGLGACGIQDSGLPRKFGGGVLSSLDCQVSSHFGET